MVFGFAHDGPPADMARSDKKVPSALTHSNPTRKRGPVSIRFFALFCLAHASGYCDIFFRTIPMLHLNVSSANIDAGAMCRKLLRIGQ